MTLLIKLITKALLLENINIKLYHVKMCSEKETLFRIVFIVETRELGWLDVYIAGLVRCIGIQVLVTLPLKHS